MGKHTKPGCLAWPAAFVAVVAVAIGALSCGGDASGPPGEQGPRVGGECRLEGQRAGVRTGAGGTRHDLTCHDGHWEPV